MQNRLKRAAIASVCSVLGLAALLSPQPVLGQEDLKNKVDKLEQELQILKRQLELDKEASAEKAKITPVITAGASGFTLRSPDTNFVLKIRGYLQADARFYPGDDSGSGVNDSSNDTFLLRRVRPILEGTVFDKYDFRVMLDFPSGTVSSSGNNAYVQDAYLNARLFPEFQIQAGKFKEPLGLERLQSGANLLFVERAFPTQLAPNRDVGLQLQGDLLKGSLSYAAGIFNGVADGGSADIETADDDKDFAGRLFAHPFLNAKLDALRGLGIGVAGTYGNQASALRAFTTPGQQRFFAYASDVVADGDRWRLSPQAYYYWGPFGLLAEYIISNQELRRGNDVTGTFETIENTAWQVAVSYILTAENNSFKALVPRKPFTLNGDGWGAWELTARVSELDVDDDLYPNFADEDTTASKATSWGAGINWHLNRNVKLQLNYEQTDFEGGTTDFLEDGEKVILARAQIAF
jgi:phosphate-selective porin OprO and OprP